MEVPIFELAEIINKNRRKPPPDDARNFKPCPSNKQLPKHMFMQAVIDELMPVVRQHALKVHRNNRRTYNKLWSEMTQAEQQSKRDEYKWWVPHLKKSQVRLLRENLPEQMRMTPDRRRSESISHSVQPKRKSNETK